MRGAVWFVVCAGLAARGIAARAPESGAPQGQQAPAAEERVSLEMRVVEVREDGLVVVDRGRVDGLARGDFVLFRPLGGGSVRGRVISADERRAGVQLDERDVVLALGTRGETAVPRARLAPRPVPVVEAPAEPAAEPSDEPERWERGDDGWTSDQPLLARVEALRPEQRPRRVYGRLFVSADGGWTSQVGRSDVLLRTGGDVLVQNPFERGGELHVDAELDYRRADRNDANPDEDAQRLRINRASYSWGGTRFQKVRQEAGRFLQDGVPEFGVLDGYEYGRRLESGDRYGASVGFMPEPTPEFESGHDFQVSGYYQWVSDKREELSATAGYQRSFHNGAADRDLLLGKLRYLPGEGWDFDGTLWVDLYTGGDDAKGTPVDLTRAQLSTGRRWDEGHALTVALVHQSFPDIERYEFEPPTASRLADDRSERLSVSGWRQLASGNRWHGHVGLWVDQDDAGGDLESGYEWVDFGGRGGRAELTGFAAQGAYSLVLGARAAVGGQLARARWDLSYEVSQHDLDGFSSDNDTIWQHRVSGDLGLYGMGAWDLHLDGSGVVWNEELSLRVAFYLSRSF
ncbi:MAG: hypothetical protein H6828_14075 [Planctomycetes bacterium]|nr:hypothetical protein [Planctomycetota bacterium]